MAWSALPSTRWDNIVLSCSLAMWDLVGRKLISLLAWLSKHILSLLQNGECHEETIKFGLECMYVDSWARRRTYNAFKETLGSGVRHHLQVKGETSWSALREYFCDRVERCREEFSGHHKSALYTVEISFPLGWSALYAMSNHFILGSMTLLPNGNCLLIPRTMSCCVKYLSWALH